MPPPPPGSKSRRENRNCRRTDSPHTTCIIDSIGLLLQVCALQWNTHEKEILSSHGFSQNQLCLWKYPSMAKVLHHGSAMPQNSG